MNEETPETLQPSVHNPFDFANPVSVKDLFVGRRKELEDIAYYLDHAKSAPRTINLALLGERASGKTSLLNIIEIEATERNLVPVRINLNESDVASHLAFWFKIFDSILSRVVTERRGESEKFVFNGELGRTYETYLDLVTAYEIPREKEFCPFLFPIIYAKAMAAGNLNPQVSDSVLNRDLKAIAEELGRPIVILVDECNLLSSKRALLEMVRNTFMNLAGFMLVFTGTPDLFPIMDEVFSPIIRQFKRIEVAPFARLIDTKDAVEKPLNSVGKASLFEMPPTGLFEDLDEKRINFRIGGELQDLHDLTGGRPYEIQLVCHFMFRRVQQQHDRRMRLSIDVLDDVLRELRQSHDVDTRSIISAVKKLDIDDLRCLDVLLRSAGRIALEELLFAAFVTSHTEELPESIRLKIPKFVEAGILDMKDDTVSFRGDDFDKIVCKYAARKRDVHLSFDPMSPKGIILSSLYHASDYEGKRYSVNRSSFLRQLSLDTEENEKCRLLNNWDSLDGMSLESICRLDDSVLAAIYEDVVEAGSTATRPIVLFRISLEGALCFDKLFYLVKGNDIDRMQDEIQTSLGKIRSRVEQLSGSLSIEQKEIGPSNVHDLFTIAQLSSSEELKECCAACHNSLTFENYVEKRDNAAALTHALLALQMLQYLPKDGLNSLGYVLLASGLFKEAEDVLFEASRSKVDTVLSLYNLALAKLSQGKRSDAKVLLGEVLERNVSDKTVDIGVLLFAELLADGKIHLVERWSNNWDSSSPWNSICLLDAARSAWTLCDDL